MANQYVQQTSFYDRMKIVSEFLGYSIDAMDQSDIMVEFLAKLTTKYNEISNHYDTVISQTQRLDSLVSQLMKSVGFTGNAVFTRDSTPQKGFGSVGFVTGGSQATTKVPVPAPDEQVNHPKHYNSHPSGVEAIVICEHMTFNVGNAMKYLFRAGIKSPDAKVDINKAIWYLQREVERISK